MLQFLCILSKGGGVTNTAFIVEFGRWVLPLIAFYVIVGCGVSLIRGNKRTGTIGYLVNSANGDKIPLTSYETSIGRSNACDIVLNYTTISRFHAVIARRGGRWLIFDTHSKTGTFVEGEKIDNISLKGYEIFSGDTITLGNANFSFLEHLPKDLDEEEIVEENPALFEGDSKFNTGEIILPKNLTFGCYLENCITKERVNIDEYDSVIIGRGEDAVIKINSPTVSRAHALLSRDKKGWIIEDLNSVAGTLLNGQEVEECTKVKNGDIIEICGFTIKFIENA